MKNILTLMAAAVLCMLHPRFALAGEPGPGGTVSGKVTTSDDKPAAGVTVQVQGKKRSTLTDEDGGFVLRNLPEGNYMLEVSLVGYETTTAAVTVKTGGKTDIALRLKVSERQLRDVVVTAGKNRFTRQQSDQVARIPLKNMENPQVYSTVTKELMQDQSVTDLNGALKNVPGVTLLLQGDNAGGDFASRGFVTDAYLRNGLAAYGTSTVDPANLERIEAIKGPSATLFGSSLTSYGGLFNRVTKKPFDTWHTEVAYTAGGYGLSRLTADVNAPLNDEKTALFRVNIADHHEGSFQDAGFTDLLFVAPSLTYQVNDRLSVAVDAEIYRQKNSAQFRYFPETGFGVTNPAALHFDYNRSFTSNDLTASNPSTNVIAQINYKLSANWRSSTNFSYSTSAGNGIWAWESVLPGDSTVARNEEDQVQRYTNFQVQQNFTGDFHTGSLRHRLVAGLDVFGYQDNVSYGLVTFDSVRVSGPDPGYARLTKTALDAALAAAPYSHDIDKQYTYAAYASDVINLTDELIAMLSLRVDHFDGKGDFNVAAGETTGAYNQTALSPKLGLVWQVVKDRVSLFGNYMNGFQNENGEDHNHRPFKPEQANQWEGGVKLSLFDGRLTSTVSYYDIKVKDVLRTDPDFPSFSIQDGTQYSKGLEAELVANPVAGLNIVAGYAHNNSKYGDIDPTLDGYRPGSAGPADVANAWISYRLQQGAVKGLGLGFGGNYGGKDNIVNESDGYFTLPAYTVLNASVSYDRPKYRLALKLDNIANKEYWVGWYTIIPQMPRRLSATLALKF